MTFLIQTSKLSQRPLFSALEKIYLLGGASLPLNLEFLVDFQIKTLLKLLSNQNALDTWAARF